MTEVVIYTDGACSGNPGPGGWGVVMRWQGTEKEMYGAEPLTTNNRMELMAAIQALEALQRPSTVVLHTDSKYLLDGITKWIQGWQRNGWKTAAKKPVKNDDLWRRLVEAMRPHDVSWVWVKGHAGDPGNERADALARRGIEEAAGVASPGNLASRDPYGGAKTTIRRQVLGDVGEPVRLPRRDVDHAARPDRGGPRGRHQRWPGPSAPRRSRPRCAAPGRPPRPPGSSTCPGSGPAVQVHDPVVGLAAGGGVYVPAFREDLHDSLRQRCTMSVWWQKCTRSGASEWIRWTESRQVATSLAWPSGSGPSGSAYCRGV